MNKELQFGDIARKSILEGMEILAKAVGSTLGPKGQCIVIDNFRDGKPLVTKDGVTVARSIELKNKFQNLGVQLLKEASLMSLSKAGDGTTTSVVLAYRMILYAAKLIADGVNPIVIKTEIEDVCNDVMAALKEQAIPIKDEDIAKVATISANNDIEIGNLIAEAFEKIGRDGVITVEESSSFKTYVDVINGMQFENGYVSPHFATDLVKGTCVLENPLVLITDRKIQLMKEIVPLLEIANKGNRSILIIAQDYDDEVIQNLKINKTRGILQVCAVKAPSYGDYRKQVLEDIAILTGAQVITYESGIELSKAPATVLGNSKKVIVTRDDTTIIDGNGKQEVITARVEQIRALENNIPDSLDQDFLKDFYAIRKARLTGGVAVIHVGGTTELEMKERKDRIDDAVCATKAAIEEGIVPGGGVSFINAHDAVAPLEPTTIESVVLDSLFAVQDTIISNCGIDPVTARENNHSSFIGFDANEMDWVDLLERGVINPVKSDRAALENAFSVLNLYLSANCLVVDEEITF